MEEIKEATLRMDWLNILRYHREVIKQGSDNFFSIPVKGVDRYAQIQNFSPEEFEGPWSITVDEMLLDFLEEYYSNNNEEQFSHTGKPTLILGCLCWKSLASGERFLNPLVYMDVSIDQVIGESIIIKPESQHWNFSPFLDTALRINQIRVQESLHEMLPGFLRDAEEDYHPDKKDLATALRDRILKEVPIFEKFLDKNVLKWILFNPPKSYEFTRHILNDYKEIGRLIEENPHEVGGLRLLEGLQNQEIHTAGELLPVVPLNLEQKHAVSHILSENPITVVSGPPGCGKSQVVVSLLINCWAEGKTALFASYVNNAVEVISERIKAIEGETKKSILPIAIKAGRKDNTIHSGIKNIKDAVIQYEPIKPEMMRALQSTKRELEAKKAEYKKCIDTGLPQQIDESIHSAFDAYAIAMEHQEKLDHLYANYLHQIENFGYQIKPDELGDLISAIENWLKHRFEYVSEIKENAVKRHEYQQAIDALGEDIGDLLATLGLNYKSRNWSLLLNDTQSPKKLLDWYVSYKSALLQEGMSRAYLLGGVKNEHRIWSDRSDVERWLSEAQKLTDAIESRLSLESESIQEIHLLHDKYQHWRHRIQGYGFSADGEIDVTTLASWKELYKEYISIPKGLFPNPFSKRSKILKELCLLEERILESFPSDLKKSIGTQTSRNMARITDQSRSKLIPYVDDLLGWSEIRKEHLLNISEEQRVHSVFSDMKEGFKTLPFFHPPDTVLDADGWQRCLENVIKKIILAEDALDEYKAQELRQGLHNTLRTFDSIAITSPVRNAWILKGGKHVHESVKGLLIHPGPESLDKACAIVMTQELELFISEWERLLDLIHTYQRKVEAMKALATEDDIIRRWWGEDPTRGVESLDQQSIPEDVGVYSTHLANCREILDSWNEHKKTTFPDKGRIIQENLRWARSEIENACRKIPDETVRSEIENQVLRRIQDHDDKWPLQQIRGMFRPYRSSEMNMKIERIDQKLQIASFEIASNQRVGMIRSMDGANIREDGYMDGSTTRDQHPLPPLRRRLNELLEFYDQAKRNSYILPQEKSDLFLGCLPAIPIWVTTSLSTQSIPRRPGIFDLVVIDEACQCDISSVLPMIYRARRLAVIGDPNQLEAINTISSPDLDRKIAKNYGVEGVPDTFRHINNNLYKLAEKSLPDNDRVIDLLEHYRSHPQIVGFINMYVYNRRLIIKKEIECNERDLAEEGIFGRDVKGYCTRVGSSWQNEREADEVVRVVRELIDVKGYKEHQIGIVTPFSPQKNLIEKKIQSVIRIPGIAIGTANTFQGNERDIMIFSPVLSQGIWDASVRFVQEPYNRINVALSRARSALYVVADFAFCKSRAGIVSELIQYIETINELRMSAKERGYEQLYLYTLMLVEGWKPVVNMKVGGRTVDLAIPRSKTHIGIIITSKDIPEDEMEIIKDELESKIEFMIIPDRKISETPKEVIANIHELVSC